MSVRPAPGIPIEQQPEPVVIRMTLWGEARGEPAIGKLAILWVLHNRALKHDTSMKHEALRPWQFSSFNANDPNRARLLSAWQTDPKAWQACDEIAEMFEREATQDPTQGATHYFAHDVVHPAWGPGHKDWEETAVIGGHTFGRAA